MVKKRGIIEREQQLTEMIGNSAEPVKCSDDVCDCIGIVIVIVIIIVIIFMAIKHEACRH